MTQIYIEWIERKKRVIVTVSVLHIHGLPSNVSTAIDIKPTEDSFASRVPLARSFLASTLSLLVCFFFFFLVIFSYAVFQGRWGVLSCAYFRFRKS